MDLEPPAAQPPEPSSVEPGPTSVPARRRSTTTVALAIALTVAIVGDGALAVRLRDQQDATHRLEAELAQSEKTITDLQGSVRALPGDPLQKLEAAVSKLRGLTFKHAVQPELLTPAEFRARVHETFVSENKRADLSGTAKVLVTLGVIPANLDLYTFLQRLQEEQIAGFYDSKAKKLVVRANDIKDPSPLDRVLLAHELTHALTDQYYDLTRIDALQKARKDDEQEAFLSLAEGDAQLTMQLYAQQVLTPAEQQQLAEESAAMPSSNLDSAPKFISDELGFPYTTGLEFVTQLHSRGGFAAVDRAYDDPPKSTEQIIHPARYIDARDDPVTVTLPDIAAKLGAGWKKIDDGGVGELDLRDIADFGGGQGLSEQQARTAAAGWDGGRYAGFSSTAGTLVAQEFVFDSESEAREAQHALSDWLALRYGNVGKEFSIGAGNGRGWDAGSEGAGEVLRWFSARSG